MVDLVLKINSSAVFVFFGLLALNLLFYIWRSIFKFRVFGLSLKLLIGLEISVLAIVLN